MRCYILASIICISSLSPAFTQTVGGMSDITVLSVDIGRFEWGSKIIHIYENTRNQSIYSRSPERWQFIIEPLLTPRLNPNPTTNIKMDYRSESLDSGVRLVAYIDTKTGKRRTKSVPFLRTRVLIPLDLITQDARDRALDAIFAAYPSVDKCAIGRPNVDVLPVTDITFTISDLEDQKSVIGRNVRFHTKTLNFLTSPKELFLSFDVDEEDQDTSLPVLQKFLAFFPFLEFDAQISFSVKSTKFNIASIDIDKLKNTALWVDLSGNGGVGFVSRTDLRNLAQSAAASIRSSFTIEDPASFDQNFIDSLITSSQNITADEAFFNSEQGKQTYNADDLKPDVVTREINKLITKDATEDQWTFNGSASANANVLGLVSGGFSGSLSGSSLKKWLSDRDIESDIQGNKIIAKSIQIKQVNLSNFVSSYNYGTEYRNVSGAKSNLRTVIFGDVPLLNTAAPSFTKRSASCPNTLSLMLR